mmetsp:Transcript_35920/g.75560  ORF Transcript_35920/g.75560 Transcript_35920/m.75560 type:complete len:101 (-) Transcript_35920:760-1062(-)
MEVGNFYTKVVTNTLCLMQEQKVETGQKGFTDIQKGALQGFCMVSSWDNIPVIWTQIESANQMQTYDTSSLGRRENIRETSVVNITTSFGPTSCSAPYAR